MLGYHSFEESLMNRILFPALLVLVLSACSSTNGTQATVEDRTGGTASSGQAAGDSKPAAGSGTETTGLGAAGVSGSALDASRGDPRKDPASPLSKRSIFFEYDSFVVKDEYRPVLEAHAGYLLSRRDSKVMLQGNADERGSREYNLALGQKRADAVRKALSVLGVGEAQMEAVSFGEEKPRNEADTEEAYAENRRVDVVYGDE
jgi:peptidoglycan-associated lipoprotein